MAHQERSVSRRSVLLAGAAVVGGLGLAGPAEAAVRARAARVGTARAPVWAKLSTRQQAGQRVVYSYPGMTPSAQLFDLIRGGEVGGVIFFGENINKNDTSQIAAVIDQLDAAQAQGPVDAPLLLMTDQEGGIVRRLPGEPVLSAKEMGEQPDPVAAAAAGGDGAGANLASVGMNVNLAPVLDVYREEGNFDDQFGRSFSSDPVLCAEMGAAFIEAQRPHGVASTAKHFPGLGAAAQDQNTDLGPVILTQSLADIRDVDERPFVDAVAVHVEMIMTSWATYPALDAELPAGLSPTIVQDELRGRLGYGGVTITDALEAGALNAYTTAQRGVMAAQAGMDVLLCSARDVSQGTATVDALTAALEDKTLNPGHSRQALRRVMDLRARLG